MLPEGIELNFSVAENVRIGRDAALVANQKRRKHVIPVFADKVDVVRPDAERPAVIRCGKNDVTNAKMRRKFSSRAPRPCDNNLPRRQASCISLPAHIKSAASKQGGQAIQHF
jgi:hypothetical protein